MDKQQAHLIRGILIGLGVAFSVLLIFAFGVFVGEQKARFSYRWGESYHRFFGGPPLGPGRPRGFFSGHGTAGVLVKKEKARLIIRSPDNIERIILIDKDTFIVKGRERLNLEDIKEGDRLVVIGEPNNKGQVKARLIRVFAKGLWKESMWREKPLHSLPSLPL